MKQITEITKRDIYDLFISGIKELKCSNLRRSLILIMAQ